MKDRLRVSRKDVIVVLMKAYWLDESSAAWKVDSTACWREIRWVY